MFAGLLRASSEGGDGGEQTLFRRIADAQLPREIPRLIGQGIGTVPRPISELELGETNERRPASQLVAPLHSRRVGPLKPLPGALVLAGDDVGIGDDEIELVVDGPLGLVEVGRPLEDVRAASEQERDPSQGRAGGEQQGVVTRALAPLRCRDRVPLRKDEIAPREKRREIAIDARQKTVVADGLL